MGEHKTVSIQEIRDNDNCLHPAHYINRRCPYHHKDLIRKDQLMEKIAFKEAEIADMKKEVEKLETELSEVENGKEV